MIMICREVMSLPCHCRYFLYVPNLLRVLDVYWKEEPQQILFYPTTTYSEWEIVHDSTALTISTNQNAGAGQVSGPEPIRAEETNDCWRRQARKVTETICQIHVLGKQRPDLMSSSNIWRVSIFHMMILLQTLETFTEISLLFDCLF